VTYKEIQDVFNALGLSTSEQRKKILSQGTPDIFVLASEPKIEFQTWASNQSKCTYIRLTVIYQYLKK